MDELRDEYPFHITCDLYPAQLNSTSKELFKKNIDHYYFINDVDRRENKRNVTFIFKNEHDKLLFVLVAHV